MEFDRFVRVYRKARRDIKAGKFPEGAMTSVMMASRNLRNCTRREIDLAIAYTVVVEDLVQPASVDSEWRRAAARCIGSNGRYGMPLRDWQEDA